MKKLLLALACFLLPATALASEANVGTFGKTAPTQGALLGGKSSTLLEAITSTSGRLDVNTTVLPSSSSSYAIAPVVSTAAESNHVLKNAAGNLYSVYATTGAAAGYLMVFNATSAPVDGAVTPIHCIPVGAGSTAGLSFAGGPPESFSTGITAVFSTTGCFTKTASATAFFHGSIK